MGIIKDFERSLGDDPDPFLRRLLRAGVRPTELAEALQDYLADQQQVTDDGVVVPNVFRLGIGSTDHARLSGYGVELPRGLGTVVVETAAERGWLLLGPVRVRIERDELVPTGRYQLAGRVEHVEGWGPSRDLSDTPSDRGAHTDLGVPLGAASGAVGAGVSAMSVPLAPGSPAPAGAMPVPDTRSASAPLDGVRDPGLEVRTGVDAGTRLILDGGRVTAGRGSSCDLVVRDTTVSREHAAFVRRGDTWWVLDLGSTNGTRVNGLRAAEHPIAPGDRIELGDVVVEFVEV